MKQKPAQENASLKLSFFSDFGHELENSLAAIRAGIELLEEKDLSPDLKEDIFKTIRQAEERLLHLIRGGVSYLRIAHQGKLRTAKKFSLEKLLQEISNEFGLAFGERNITFSISCKRPIVLVGDRRLVRELFVLLLGTLYRHTNAGGAIAIKITCTKASAAVAVGVSKLLIPSRDLPLIFTPLSRKNSFPLEDGGLGLALARAIAEKHGGSIIVKRGKAIHSFIVHLPR